jgi:hypothetical protein
LCATISAKEKSGDVKRVPIRKKNHLGVKVSISDFPFGGVTQKVGPFDVIVSSIRDVICPDFFRVSWHFETPGTGQHATTCTTCNRRPFSTGPLHGEEKNRSPHV